MGVAVTSIRRALEADVPAMAAMEGSNQPKPWSEGVFRDELATPNRIYFVAEDEGLVGFGGVMMVGDEAHITNLLVDPDGRRSGFGNRLMRGLIDAAIENGAKHLTLEVRSHVPGVEVPVEIAVVGPNSEDETEVLRGRTPLRGHLGGSVVNVVVRSRGSRVDAALLQGPKGDGKVLARGSGTLLLFQLNATGSEASIRSFREDGKPVTLRGL